jgi:hypothetical protein
MNFENKKFYFGLVLNERENQKITLCKYIGDENIKKRYVQNLFFDLKNKNLETMIKDEKKNKKNQCVIKSIFENQNSENNDLNNSEWIILE